MYEQCRPPGGVRAHRSLSLNAILVEKSASDAKVSTLSPSVTAWKRAEAAIFNQHSSLPLGDVRALLEYFVLSHCPDSIIDLCHCSPLGSRSLCNVTLTAVLFMNRNSGLKSEVLATLSITQTAYCVDALWTIECLQPPLNGLQQIC